ncbi:UPF0674 endoplasmic reticulum membrane protein [Sphaceloma murrayae]|uniref:UPF0674 endoplasmic reticulum membrane protein n=1 Tax=Sphaceloma murrayae TaxID=2082308 RepID=A0A2K1QVS6_9PEZI|nr:UPF0674 endoplasmic reticulum membrane protein [Sphaceloma murrayae]
MADIIKGLFGGSKPSAQAPLQADNDFADFAAAPSPEAAASPSLSTAAAAQTFGPNVPFSARPYTKWYRVNERVSRQDFMTEFFVLPLLLLLVLFHVWGTRKNRSKARQWISEHASTLKNEFAVVGFAKRSVEGDDVADPDKLIKEKGKDLYLSYATGRQNVAFADIKFSLVKRYNPLSRYAEATIGFFFESFPAAVERVEITAYAFDGHEADVVPRVPGQEAPENKGKSTYEGFVWGVVHKDRMKSLRDERYDLSLTITKENAKLPDWATVMSESAEITDMLLTNELVAAIKGFGEDFESIVITDLPDEAPRTLNDLQPKKRLILTTKLSSSAETSASTALLASFLRLPDYLVSLKFRPEVMRRVRATRDDESKKIKKIEEQEKAEGQKDKIDKAKKEERERKLKGMSAEEQRKFLEKEKQKDQRKRMGRATVKA